MTGRDIIRNVNKRVKEPLLVGCKEKRCILAETQHRQLECLHKYYVDVTTVQFLRFTDTEVLMVGGEGSLEVQTRR